MKTYLEINNNNNLNEIINETDFTNPNLLQFCATKDIEIGDEILWAYEMIENENAKRKKESSEYQNKKQKIDPNLNDLENCNFLILFLNY